MPQNSTNINGLSNESLSGVNPESNHHITAISCTPPPSYHNINLPPGHPAVLVNDRGAPPSYEEVIDPNGTNFFFMHPFPSQFQRTNNKTVKTG